ncbi:hypothetical protein LCGC14_2537640 [marine sediment metagenome]|uniref:Uncharacterized protein n=1 Tax=marine sediment metagenome TaxID=412755 RepID=A0A0F9D3B1_9ZZZZ
MDRREARRSVLRQIGFIEEIRDKLATLVVEIDAAGDPIVAGELRRYNEKLTDLLDKWYVWAGNL